MKRTILIYIFIFTAISLTAQDNKTFRIASFAGNVIIDENSAVISNEIRENQLVVIPENSQITLLDEKNQLLYSFTTPGERTLKELLADRQVSVTKLTGSFLKYIKDIMFQKEDKEQKLSKKKTGARRGEEEDILFIASLCNKLKQGDDSVTIQEALLKNGLPDSDFDVSFQIVSLINREPLLSEKQVKNPYVLYVANNEDKLLFVNVLYIDKKEEKYYLVLQPQEDAGFMNYLLPAKSTLFFSESPFILSDIKNDAFILIATDFPIDFSLLEEPIQIEPDEKVNFNIGFSKIEINR